MSLIQFFPPPDAALRTADGVFQVWEKRDPLVKNEVAAASAATDAKTARLKALRLEKEALDAEAARVAAETAPRAPEKKRVKRGSRHLAVLFHRPSHRISLPPACPPGPASPDAAAAGKPRAAAGLQPPSPPGRLRP